MGAIITLNSQSAFLWLEKFSYYICIPFFLAAALTDGLTLDSLKPSGLTHGVTAALLVARIVGKPIGIFTGYWLAGQRTLTRVEIGTISLLGIFGLSVSLLFIHVATTESGLVASATKAIIYINLIALISALAWGQIVRRRATS
jgi:Na+/H+ antiporter NhaA